MKKVQLQLQQLHLKNFRCFTEKIVDFSSSIVLIEGLNGSGKTSLLEALHYLCYLRSFRTHSPRELLHDDQKSFFVKASFVFDDPLAAPHEVQVGFSGAKRLVKVNQKVVCSFKELLDYYRVVALTEDDLALIKEGPEGRRAFIDQAIMLSDVDFINKLKAVRQVADNRNSLLIAGRTRDNDLYQVLTNQLWVASRDVQLVRAAALERLAVRMDAILDRYFQGEYAIDVAYKPKLVALDQTLDEFLKEHPALFQEELRYGRSLFGAHLDDFGITFDHKKSKNFASRGQQKLIVMLLKIAHAQELLEHKGSLIFLLDDFMTDFDERRVETLLRVLASLQVQLIFTVPARTSFLENTLLALGGQKITLTH
jgi:DNA replication and repair protein RecF